MKPGTYGLKLSLIGNVTHGVVWKPIVVCGDTNAFGVVDGITVEVDVDSLVVISVTRFTPLHGLPEGCDSITFSPLG